MECRGSTVSQARRAALRVGAYRTLRSSLGATSSYSTPCAIPRCSALPPSVLPALAPDRRRHCGRSGGWSGQALRDVNVLDLGAGTDATGCPGISAPGEPPAATDGGAEDLEESDDDEAYGGGFGGEGGGLVMLRDGTLVPQAYLMRALMMGRAAIGDGGDSDDDIDWADDSDDEDPRAVQ